MNANSYLSLLSQAKRPLQCNGRAGCSHCAVTFTVDRAMHLKHRAFVQQKKEYGGSLRFDFRQRKLVEGQVDSGAYNNISMSRGGVDWHSHPAHCLNDRTCALGLPSPMDLQNITLGCLFGTVAHMVYAREGTYLVQVDVSLLDKLRQSYEATSQFFADIHRTFGSLHHDFVEHTREPYKSYCRKWRRLARMSGFRVRLFAGNKVPQIKFRCMCDLLSSDKVVHPEVVVPTTLEQAFNRR